jgi:hypothetical protein
MYGRSLIAHIIRAEEEQEQVTMRSLIYISIKVCNFSAIQCDHEPRFQQVNRGVCISNLAWLARSVLRKHSKCCKIATLRNTLFSTSIGLLRGSQVFNNSILPFLKYCDCDGSLMWSHEIEYTKRWKTERTQFSGFGSHRTKKKRDVDTEHAAEGEGQSITTMHDCMEPKLWSEEQMMEGRTTDNKKVQCTYYY